VGDVEVCLPSKYKALSSNYSTAKMQRQQLQQQQQQKHHSGEMDMIGDKKERKALVNDESYNGKQGKHV
jgi:hypothetical protein